MLGCLLDYSLPPLAPTRRSDTSLGHDGHETRCTQLGAFLQRPLELICLVEEGHIKRDVVGRLGVDEALALQIAPEFSLAELRQFDAVFVTSSIEQKNVIAQPEPEHAANLVRDLPLEMHPRTPEDIGWNEESVHGLIVVVSDQESGIGDQGSVITFHVSRTHHSPLARLVEVASGNEDHEADQHHDQQCKCEELVKASWQLKAEDV